MRDEIIERIAQKARKIISQIPFSKGENIDFSTYNYGDPIVYYETHTDGFYMIIDERGESRESKVANNTDEMVACFVEQAIRAYAHSYELKHRRKFESNLRQAHEVMEKCYHYIDPKRKFVKSTYDDEIHIYLDLLDEYRKVALDYKQKYPEKYTDIKEDIDFITEKKYADTPSGGMRDVKKSMGLVRERILRMAQYDMFLSKAYDSFERYYVLLTK